MYSARGMCVSRAVQRKGIHITMSKISLGILPLIACLGMAGCARAPRPAPSPEPRPLGRDLSTAGITERDPAPKPGDPTGRLVLHDALAAALMSSPELSAFSWEVRAKEAEVLQARLRPNPEIGAELENFGGSGEFSGLGGSETTVSLSQRIELGGKRGKRHAVAQYEKNLAAWDYETLRIDVLTETKKRFVEVLAAQEQLALVQELAGVAAEVLESVSRRVEAGSTSPVEESRARVELETTRIQRVQAERSLAAARQRLSAMWGGTTPIFTEAVGSLEDVPAPPSLEVLETRLEQSPTLARWGAELARHRAALELERSLGVPDLSLGAGVRHVGDADDAALVFEVGLPLPLFDRNQGGSRAAAMRLRRAEREERAAAVRTRTRLAVSHEVLLAAEAEVLALRDRAVPEAEAAFEAAQDAYLRGSMRFTDVLDTERLLFELKSRYFAALADYHSAVVDMERLLGESFQTIREDSGGTQP